MNIKTSHKVLLLLLILFVVGCHSYENFITYFNTYYNMERLMDKSEDEFEFMAYDNQQIKVYTPKPEMEEPADHSLGPPPFMKEFIISQRQRQAVKVKLDSIIIKGSKILARHGKSDYVEGSLFLMAKTYFYQEEWRSSQIKCSELVDKYPAGEFSPDAHLLFAKNALIQRNFHTGKIMLSRTVDIAWHKDRYDILSEAFRLQAELALYEDNLEDALRPYRQAVAQSNNDKYAAKWQLELAALLYKMRYFERSASEFARVRNFDASYEELFESYLYEALSLIRIEKYEDANEILTFLENDSKYEEWNSYTYAGRLLSKYKQGDKNEISRAENHADTAHVNNPLITTYYFERGMDLYEEDDYRQAMQYLAKSRSIRTPVFNHSNQMFKYLSDLSYKLQGAGKNMSVIENPDTTASDTLRYITSSYYFEAGRIHENLDNLDSARYYYQKSFEISPKEWQKSSQFLHSYARSVREVDAYKSDSLFEVLANNYTFTEYGEDAMDRLGFTENFVVDTVQEYFSSAQKNFIYGDYNFAIEQYLKVYKNHPEDKLAPRSLYQVGWIYERNLKNLDSAIKYFDLLVKEYPKTEYAQDIVLPLAGLKNSRYDEEIPDSLKFQRSTLPKEEVDKKNEDLKKFEKINNKSIQNARDKENLNTDEIINNPSSVFEKSKESISKPLDQLKNIDVDKLNPMNLFESEEEPTEKNNIEENPPKEKMPKDTTNKNN